MIEAATWPDGPQIRTARLLLRPHRLDDLEARIAFTADEETTRFMGGPQSPEENWHRLMRYAGHWALFGSGMFAVEEQASGRLAGEVGLADFHRGLGDDFDPTPEAGWALAGWAGGQGYAAEALRAVFSWHEGAFGPARKVCMISPDNIASVRLSERLGFVPMREAEYKGHPVILFERPAATPQAS